MWLYDRQLFELSRFIVGFNYRFFGITLPPCTMYFENRAARLFLTIRLDGEKVKAASLDSAWGRN